MPDHTLKCWRPGCAGQIQTSCQPFDVPVACGACQEVTTFVNLAKAPCPTCGQELTVSLSALDHFDSIPCEHCFQVTQAGVIREQLRIYPLAGFMKDTFGEGGSGSSLHYCGRSNFEDLEHEVTYARDTLERALRSRSLGGAKSSPKSIFIRCVEVQEIGHPDLPIHELRLLHGYCNFKTSSYHENAKYYGTRADFGGGYLFKELVEKHGLVNAFFEDVALLEELKSLAPQVPYRRHFKLVQEESPVRGFINRMLGR